MRLHCGNPIADTDPLRTAARWFAVAVLLAFGWGAPPLHALAHETAGVAVVATAPATDHSIAVHTPADDITLALAEASDTALDPARRYRSAQYRSVLASQTAAYPRRTAAYRAFNPRAPPSRA